MCINFATYFITLARSVGVCVQQRCHHFWPGLSRCGTMQRQSAVLRKRIPRANVSTQPCSQHQGMHVEALPPPLARLGFLRHNAAAERRPAQEETDCDVSMPYRQTSRLTIESLRTTLMGIFSLI